MSVAETMLRGLLVLAGLVLPGAGWAFAGRWPLPWFAAGVVSIMAIFAGVVGLACLGWPVTGLSLGLWLGLVGGMGAWFWRRRRVPEVATSPRVGDWWLALPVVPMLVVAAWRAVVQPLPGVDADFRWNQLALMLAQTGGMDNYPPANPEAFAHYFWADGIAPLVAGVYAWTYLATASVAKVWTAIPVLLQVIGLLALVHALARMWQPEARAGWFACGLVAGTMLLQFSVNLGQETGCTALGAGGMVLYLMHWRRSRETALLVPAALCAGLAACAREYGAFFGVLGGVWVLLVSRQGRSLLLFGALAGTWPLIWHLRVWHLTGNPLYAHDVGGLFPLNPVFNAWMQDYAALYGQALATVDGWREIFRVLGLCALPAVCGIVVGLVLWRRNREALAWAVMLIGTVAVWLASVPLTAGGLFYSMRVLSPLLVLACAWGGAALARWVPARKNLGALLLALGLYGADAALRALTIPLNPYATPPAEWLRAGYHLQENFQRQDEPFILAVTQRVDGRVLSESAGVQHVFLRAGKTLTPLWSPDVQFLFSADYQGDAVTRLRDLGFTHVLLTRVQSSVDFLAHTGALRRLDGRLEPVMANGTFILFALKPADPVVSLP